ncbi:hypothetical protein WJX73_004452 [Symbiochloris irregularis]|uniref:Uncharacterized protein n=1 Tax=Symbiochloris irregularis TaxID=706552 RepID=A0AAW1NP89_9CHLO
MPATWPRRRVVLSAAAAGATVLLLYKAYRGEYYRKVRDAVIRLHQAGGSFSAALLAGGDISATLLSDLRQFLASDSTEVPVSLRQLARLAQSEEVTAAAAALSAALLRGASRSQPTTQPHQPSRSDADTPPAPDLLERLLIALDSERGQNLVGLAVSMACRTSVQTLVDSWASADPHSPVGSGGVHLHVESLASGFGEGLAQQRAAAGGWLQTLLQWAATPEGEHLVLNAVSTFVRQGTQVYMQSFGESNMFDDMLAAAGNPRHWQTAQTLMRTCINEAVGTWAGQPSGSRPIAARHPVSQQQAHTTAHYVHTSQPEQHPMPGPSSSPVRGCSPARSFSGLSQRSEVMSDASPTGANAAADLDSAFEEGLTLRDLHKPKLPLRRPNADSAVPAESSAAPVVAAEPGNASWMNTIMEVIKKPEARSLILAMTPVVVSEALRTGLLCTRDFGKNMYEELMIKTYWAMCDI